MSESSSGVGSASVSVPRPDIMIAPTAARPTPKPPRVSFGDVLAAGAGVAAQGASTVLSALPGSPMSAPAVRQGMGGPSTLSTPNGGGVAEGPGVGVTPMGSGMGGSTGGLSVGGVTLGSGGSDGSSGDAGSSINAALQQSANLNLYYLQLQQQEDAQNRQFTAESNIEKTRHDTAKNAIGNVGQ